MQTMRTRLKNGLIAEFLPPSQYSKKVVILCDGMPSVPSKKSLMEFLAKKGYWVFHLRYGGTWESSGLFLKHSPHEDVLFLISQLPRGFISVWNKKRYKIRPTQITVIGASFGGTCALLCSLDRRVDKVVSICPVIDWREMKQTVEPIGPHFKFVKQGFGEAYRMDPAGENKLLSGKFYNPINYLPQYDGSKVLIIQAMDDKLVLPKASKEFARNIRAKFLPFRSGGHFSASVLMDPRAYSAFKKHVKQKTAR